MEKAKNITLSQGTMEKAKNITLSMETRWCGTQCGLLVDDQVVDDKESS